MTNKEKEILDWEFEEMLRNLVSAYLKLNKIGFDSFITSIDTHEVIKEVYDIRITKRGSIIERPQGKWLKNKVAFHFTCDYCGCNIRQLKSEVFEGNYNYNFCPNCGADMKEGEDHAVD